MENEKTYWISSAEKDLRKQMDEEFLRGIMWGFPKRAPREQDNVKLAWVEINNQRVMLGVDNKTMKGYKMKKKTPEVKIPLKEQKYDKFIRWCTTFDL